MHLMTHQRWKTLKTRLSLLKSIVTKLPEDVRLFPMVVAVFSLLCIARVELGIILFGGYNSDPDPYVHFTPIMHSKIPRCFCRKMIQSNQHGDEFQAVSMALKSDKPRMGGRHAEGLIATPLAYRNSCRWGEIKSHMYPEVETQTPLLSGWSCTLLYSSIT